MSYVKHLGDLATPVVPVRSDVRSPTRSEVRSPTRTSTEVRSPTSTSTEVRSPTSTSTEVRSPTSTSTDAYTSGNVTVTGGAGAGATTSVSIYSLPYETVPRADAAAHRTRSGGASGRMISMIRETMAERTPAPMPEIMRSTMGPRAPRPASMSQGGMQLTPLAWAGLGLAAYLLLFRRGGIA